MVTQPQSTLTLSSAQPALLKSSAQPSMETITHGQVSVVIDALVNAAQVPLTATTVGPLMMSLTGPLTVPGADPSPLTIDMETSVESTELQASATTHAMAHATGVTSLVINGTMRVVLADACQSRWNHQLMSMVTESAVQAKDSAMTHVTAEPVGHSETLMNGNLKTLCAAANHLSDHNGHNLSNTDCQSRINPIFSNLNSR